MGASVNHLKHLVNHLLEQQSTEDMEAALRKLLTPSELAEVANRHQICEMLKKGIPQRQIAETLGVAIGTVTRGSNYLKKLEKEKYLRKQKSQQEKK